MMTTHPPLLRFAIVSCSLAAAALLGSGTARAAGPDSTVLARVNGEPIRLERFLASLGDLHAEAGEAGSSVPQKDPTELLGRLVDIELCLQEARTIGLDELPEFTKAVKVFREDTLRGALLDSVAREVPPPPAEEIERRVRERTAEVELSSLEFASIEDAQAFFEGLRRGDDFAFAAARLVEQKRAQNTLDHGWFRRAEVLPEVAQALEPLEPGQFTAPVPLGSGFVVMQLHGTRTADDPDARETVEREAEAEARRKALLEYIEGLRAKYLKTDEQVLASLDFEADPKAFDAYLEDRRVVVEIKDGEPVRVQDIARTLKSRMFHGVEQAVKSQRLNRSIPNVIEELTTERIIQIEALRRGLDRDPRFAAAVEEYSRSLLFGVFVRKVIDPSVKVEPADVQAYYDAHVSDYTSPEMVRLDSLAFARAEAAAHALERLNAGADLGWMRANAEAQAAPESVPQELRFDRRILLQLDTLPSGLVGALAGAAAGDFRIWAELPDRHHVLAVVERIAPKAQPLDQVREPIARLVFAEKRETVVRDWTAKLRAASEIEILVDAARLRELVSGSKGAAGAS